MKGLNTFLQKNILLKNSLYLITSNGTLSLGGFVFWIFVARFYSTYDIGIATSLIAVVGLISSLSLLGFNTGIIRFLPTSKDKNILINSIIFIVGATAFLLSFVVSLNIGILSPSLTFITRNPFFLAFFTIFTVFTSLNLLLEAILIAFRSAKYVLIKNVFQATIKLCLPFLCISLGGYGIFGSFYGGGVVAFAIAALVLYKVHNVIYRVKVNTQETKHVVTLSLGTYISGLMPTISLYLLPILITNTLGPAQTAFYYIVVTTTNVLNLIPMVIAQNLMVEGSYDVGDIKLHLKKAILITFALLTPCIVLILFFGNYILLVFGKQYSTEGLMLLRLLSFCSLLVGSTFILSTLIVIFNKIKSLIIANTLYAIVLFGTSYYFIHLGIVGIGYANIVSQLILVMMYLLILTKTKNLYS